MLKHDAIRRDLLMTREEGQSWHQFKARLGPIYPGYESFDVYMKWMRWQLENYGCVDFLEHHWTHGSYRVNDWPNHDSGALGLTVDGEEIPVATILMLSPSTGQAGLDGDLLYYDCTRGAPEEGAFRGRIVVMEELPMPDKPFDSRFLESFVVTDTNYRSDPQPPAAMLEIPDPQVNNSWFTRWAFSQWMFTLIGYAVKGQAAGFIIVSRLTYGTLKGLYDRQKRHNIPSLVLDRVNGQRVLAAARAGKRANLKIISEFFPADAWNFVCFLPGAHYGTDRDQQISINTHVDAMSLTQDNGSLGALGVVRYFAQLPRDQRQKTLLICVDSRHFIEGFENGNMAHDPYVVYPQLREKLVASLGLEHMGEMEAAEDFAHNTMVPTGRSTPLWWPTTTTTAPGC